MTRILLEKGYNVATLSDGHSKWYKPTYEIIMLALEDLISNKKAGDNLVFYFSGHGTQENDGGRDERDGLDECIVSSDWRAISDNTLRDTFERVPDGVSCTAIMDCCHSGTLFDGQHRLIHGDKNLDRSSSSARLRPEVSAPLKKPATTNTRFIPLSQVEEQYNKLHGHRDTMARSADTCVARSMALPQRRKGRRADTTLLLSACEEGEKCLDVAPHDGTAPFGLFTKALEVAYRQRRSARYDELVWEVRRMLRVAGFSQNPCLEGTRAMASVAFLQ